MDATVSALGLPTLAADAIEYTRCGLHSVCAEKSALRTSADKRSIVNDPA
jgi:hypothetical protein